MFVKYFDSNLGENNCFLSSDFDRLMWYTGILIFDIFNIDKLKI